MYRFIESELLQWSKDPEPLPILLRGARQVGKTHTVVNFAKQNFENYIHINLETDKDFIADFKTLDPHRIINKIYALKNIKVETAKTLIFIDEIQECPEAIVSLRYFYEQKPGLHVIAAGSLLDFTLNSADISMPVGRIQYLFMQPMNFMEFLLACGNKGLSDYIKQLDLCKPTDLSIHLRLLEELKTYMMLGGMPGVLARYLKHNKTFPEAFKYQDSIINTYQDDFKKYGKKSEQKYLLKTFQAVPGLVGRKLKYSSIDRDYKAINLRNAVELLIEANLIHLVKATNPQSKPLAVLASDKDFKPIFLDLGLMQKIFGLDLELVYSGDWHSSAAGGIAEQLVGQELLSYSDCYKPRHLYYWYRDRGSAKAEIDFLININNQAIPIEVKSGSNGHLKSLKQCMAEYKLNLGIKCSEEDLAYEHSILSVPLYAVSELRRLVIGLNQGSTARNLAAGME